MSRGDADISLTNNSNDTGPAVVKSSSSPVTIGELPYPAT